MWEAIRQNQRRSWTLILVMATLLVALGFTVGFAVGELPGAGFGVLVAVVLWLILFLVAMYQGDALLLMSSRAHEIQKADAPRLWNVVEEMTIAAGLKKMPRVFIIEDDLPNAFAVGRKEEKAAVAITSGLLKRLNRDELQGVMAHEIAHVKNLDVRFMTLAAVMVGAIVLLSHTFLRSLFYGAGRRSSSSRGGGGQAQIVFLVVAILVAILAPIFARILYFACSRRREYLADASAARYTRYPEGLASALEKISVLASAPEAGKKVNGALAPLYIVNPTQALAASGAFTTHPPTDKRVKILRTMGGGAGYVDYEAAYKKIVGGTCIGSRTLGSGETIAAREASAEDKKKDSLERIREVAGVLDRAADFLPILCACGVNIKVPPGLKRDSVPCPKCGSKHAVPRAESATDAAGATGAATAEAGADAPPVARETAPLRYERRIDGWDSFKCRCGKVIQLSPNFVAPTITCRACREKIEIVTPAKSAASS